MTGLWFYAGIPGADEAELPDAADELFTWQSLFREESLPDSQSVKVPSAVASPGGARIVPARPLT